MRKPVELRYRLRQDPLGLAIGAATLLGNGIYFVTSIRHHQRGSAVFHGLLLILLLAVGALIPFQRVTVTRAGIRLGPLERWSVVWDDVDGFRALRMNAVEVSTHRRKNRRIRGLPVAPEQFIREAIEMSPPGGGMP